MSFSARQTVAWDVIPPLVLRRSVLLLETLDPVQLPVQEVRSVLA
jgi:hypothetical protein